MSYKDKKKSLNISEQFSILEGLHEYSSMNEKKIIGAFLK